MNLRTLLVQEFDSEKELLDHRIEVLQQAIRAKEKFYFPTEVDPEKNGTDKAMILMAPIELDNGMISLPVFTSEEAILESGEDFGAQPIDIDDLLQAFIISQDFDGILINSYDDDSPLLTRALVQRILEPFVEEKLDRETAKDKINAAIHFAAEMHTNQFRKGTDRPYIIHPLEVMNLLEQMGADPNLMIAGLLHDVVEDTGATLKMIAKRFGMDVAALVAAHSENKSRSWRDRKAFCIEETNNGSRRLKMLVLADSLSNQSAMLRDYQKIGDELWKRFKRGKEDQAWYYSGKQDALWDLQYDDGARKAYWQLVNDYKDLFVSYYLDVVKHKLYQKSSEECYVFDRDLKDWQPVPKNAPIKGIEITREFAETIEDAWNLKVEEKRQWKEWLFSDVEEPASEEIAAMIIEQLKAAGVAKK